MSMMDPEHSERNQPEGAVAVGALVVAGGQAAVLLAAVDQPLDAVALPVHRAVKRPPAPFVAQARERIAQAPPPTVAAAGTPGVPLVAHYSLGPHARPSPARAPHGALLQQALKHGRLVLLARGQHQGHRLAAAVGAQVNLGREPATAAPERFA